MGKPGTKPRAPHLKIVEGNPGKRPVKEGVRLPPGAPPEPDWRDWFPDAGDAVERAINGRARTTAAAEWHRVVPILDHQGVLNAVDAAVLADYCVCVARIEQCERHISRNGIAVLGERGWQKNPSATAVNQYRTQLRFYVGELGLSPSSRGRIEPLDGAQATEDATFD